MNTYLESLQENRATIHQILEAQRADTPAHAGVITEMMTESERKLWKLYLASLEDSIRIIDSLIDARRHAKKLA